MGLRKLLSGWCRNLPFDICPGCGAAARQHELRVLARERFAPGLSGVEGRLARRDFAAAAALDDPRALGDRLVHHVLRCADRVVVVTVAEPVGLGMDAQIRGTLVVEGSEAEAAWKCAR